jgi:hypothetical protein
MEFLVIAVLIGLIPAAIAQSKGKSFMAWWLYGAALFIVALPHSLLVSADVKQIEREQLQSGNSRKCPFCAEIIKAEAIVCRYCGRDIPSDASEQLVTLPKTPERIIDEEELDNRMRVWQSKGR